MSKHKWAVSYFFTYHFFHKSYHKHLEFKLELDHYYTHIFVFCFSEEQLRTVLDQELVKLQNQSENFVFGFFDNSVLLHQSGVVIGSAGENWSSCKDIYKRFLEEEGSVSGGGSKKKGAAAFFQVSLMK